MAAAIALYRQYGQEVNYCFNRKEEKDHGEGGVMVGYPLKDGDRVVITEDVITSGAALRECLPVLQRAAKTDIVGLVVSVDRMERGTGEKSAIQQVYDDYGIRVFPIVTIRDIMDYLYQRPVDGKVYLDEAMLARMKEYLSQYGV